MMGRQQEHLAPRASTDVRCQDEPLRTNLMRRLPVPLDAPSTAGTWGGPDIEMDTRVLTALAPLDVLGLSPTASNPDLRAQEEDLGRRRDRSAG